MLCKSGLGQGVMGELLDHLSRHYTSLVPEKPRKLLLFFQYSPADSGIFDSSPWPRPDLPWFIYMVPVLEILQRQQLVPVQSRQGGPLLQHSLVVFPGIAICL